MFDENSIVDRILRGDDAAFERVIARYEHRVYQYALRFLGHQEDACAATEEIFHRMYRQIASCTDQQLSAWVFRIAAEVCAEYQHRLRGAKVSVFRLRDPFHREEHDLAEEIRLQLLRLARQQREVLLLHDLCGLNDEETGLVLGLDVSGVRLRLSRARKNLRDLLIRQNALGQPDAVQHGACQHYRELCSRYVDECIADRDKADLLDHIQTCPACSAYLNDLTVIGRSLSHLEEEQPPEELRENIIAAARQQAEHVQEHRRRTVHRPMLMILGMAAAVLTLLCSGVLGGLFVNSRYSVQPEESVPTAGSGGIARSVQEEIHVPDVVTANSYAFVIAAKGKTDLPELSTSAVLLAGDSGDGVEYYAVENDLSLARKLADGMESVGYEMETVNSNQLVISSAASQGLFIIIYQDS